MGKLEGGWVIFFVLFSFNTRATVKNVYGDYSLTINLIPGGGTAMFNLYGTGQLKLPNLASDPTSNNVIGQICMVGGNLKRWSGDSWVLV